MGEGEGGWERGFLRMPRPQLYTAVGAREYICGALGRCVNDLMRDMAPFGTDACAVVRLCGCWGFGVGEI